MPRSHEATANGAGELTGEISQTLAFTERLEFEKASRSDVNDAIPKRGNGAV